MLNGSTKTKTIIGIDYSLNSPAVCISTNGGTAFSDCYFYYLTSKKKHIGKMLENVIGYEHKEWKSPIERFTNLSGWVLHILNTLHKKQNNKHIFIEGYSYGSKGQAIFQIAENGGILKYRLQNKFTCKTIVPSVVKKLATGKGNADKQYVYESMNVDLKPIFKSKSITSPINDIADSYFICKYGHLTSHSQ